MNRRGWTVRGVQPSGSIAAWNKQCVDGLPVDKRVVIGDVIGSVNGEVYSEDMMREIQRCWLLKICVVCLEP